MPVMQTMLHELNGKFGRDQIQATATRKDAYAPGQQIVGALIAGGTPLAPAFKDYFAQMPGAIHETLRSVIHHALSTTPPTHVTFAWAPAYDWEITVWQAPDTKTTKGGVTLLIKSRYPDDAHPLAS
jgi:hypothetical protein